MRKLIILGIIVVLVSGYFGVQKYRDMSSQYCGQWPLRDAIGIKLINTVRRVVFRHQIEIYKICLFDKSKEVPITEVNNLGYNFYLGYIDTDSGVITDDLKNEITKVIHATRYPKNLSNKIPFVIVNTLALKPDLYIKLPNGGGVVKLPPFDPSFIQISGMYAMYTGNARVIFLNKKIIGKNTFAGDLAHEMGHALGDTLSDEEWLQYYRLRGIPQSAPRQNDVWQRSPLEDFAEVYRHTFTGTGVKTVYGTPNSQTRRLIASITDRLN